MLIKKLGLAALGLTLSYILLKRRRRRRRWWIRPINANRKAQGDFENLVQEMRLNDPEMFFNYMRLTVAQFDLLLSWVGPEITKHSYRENISAGARLALTLRHLAAGDSIQSLAFSYRVGKSTACVIINETCEAIWSIGHKKVLKEPNQKEWKEISVGFQNQWNLPNCVGAIDGKHIKIRAPYNSGSLYFNYKKTFSIVLFASCDSKYCFTSVDIGGYGSQSDGGILRASSFGHKLFNNLLPLPEDMPFPGMEEFKPYYFVGDEAFPLCVNLLRPYGGRNLSNSERIYNYRLSRARRCIENTFGILVARFRIFHTTIFKEPDNVDKLVKAAITLHNFIKKQEELLTPGNRKYCPLPFVDQEKNGQLILGEWRNEIPLANALCSVGELRRRLGTRNATNCAIGYRNFVRDYVNSAIGSVPWQQGVIINPQ